MNESNPNNEQPNPDGEIRSLSPEEVQDRGLFQNPPKHTDIPLQSAPANVGEQGIDEKGIQSRFSPEILTELTQEENGGLEKMHKMMGNMPDVLRSGMGMDKGTADDFLSLYHAGQPLDVSNIKDATEQKTLIDAYNKIVKTNADGTPQNPSILAHLQTGERFRAWAPDVKLISEYEGQMRQLEPKQWYENVPAINNAVGTVRSLVAGLTTPAELISQAGDMLPTASSEPGQMAATIDRLRRDIEPREKTQNWVDELSKGNWGGALNVAGANVTEGLPTLAAGGWLGMMKVFGGQAFIENAHNQFVVQRKPLNDIGAWVDTLGSTGINAYMGSKVFGEGAHDLLKEGMANPKLWGRVATTLKSAAWMTGLMTGAQEAEKGLAYAADPNRAPITSESVAAEGKSILESTGINAANVLIFHGLSLTVPAHLAALQNISEKAEDYGRHSEAYDRSVDMAKQAQVKIPEEKEQLINRMYQDKKLDTGITFDAKEIVTKAAEQAQGDAGKEKQLVDDLAEKLGTTGDKIRDAGQKGGTIDAEAPRVAVRAAYDPLLTNVDPKSIGFGEKSITGKQLDAQSVQTQSVLDDYAKKEQEKLEKTSPKTAPQEYKDLQAALVKSGLSAREATTSMTLPRSIVQQIAKRTGKSEGNVWKDWNLEVNKETGILQKKQSIVEKVGKAVKKAAQGEKVNQDERGSFHNNGGKRIIELYKTADRTTFLHEVFHAAKDYMTELVERGGLKDQTLIDDLKVLNDHDNGDPEKSAKAWERFLAEGKAPKASLMGVFDRFKSWMQDTYQHLSAISAPISDDVRGVFERMLADDQERAVAKKIYASMDAGIKSDVLKEAAQKFEKTTAEGGVYLKTWLGMNDKANEKELRAGAKEDVDQHPVYKAMDEAKVKGGINAESVRRMGVDDKTIDKINKKHGNVIVEDGKIDAGQMGKYSNDPEEFVKSMADVKPHDEMVKLLTKVRMAQLGQTMDSMLQADKENRLDSITHTEDTLKYMETRGAILEKQAQDQMAENDQKGAVKAAQDEGKAKLAEEKDKNKYDRLKQDLEAEGKLAEANQSKKAAAGVNVTPKPIDRMALREQARQKVAQMPSRELTNVRPLVERERELGDALRKAIKAGDVAGAAAIGREQTYQHALVLNALKAAKEIREIRRTSSISKINAKLENVSYDSRNLVGYILRGIGEGKARENDPQWLQKIQEDIPQAKDASEADMKQFVRRWVQDKMPDAYSSIPSWMWEKDNGGIKGLNYEQTLDYKDFTNRLIAQGHEQKMEMDNRLTNVSDIAKQFALQHQTTRDYVTLPDGDPLKGAQGAMQWVNGNLPLIQQEADELDGQLFFKTGKTGAFGSVVKYLIDQGQKKVADVHLFYHDIAPALRTLETERLIWESRFKGHYFDIPGFKIGRDIPGFRMTFENALGMALNTGSESNYRRLLAGHGMADNMEDWKGGREAKSAAMDTLMSHFSKDAHAAIQQIFDAINKHSEKGYEAYKRVNQEYPGLVEAKERTWKLQDGTEVTNKGGYYPARPDRNLAKGMVTRGAVDENGKALPPQGEAQIKTEELSDQSNAMFSPAETDRRITNSRTAVNKGMFIDRVDGQHFMPLKLGINVLADHVETMSHYANMKEATMKAQALMNDSSFSGTVISKFGKGRMDSLTDWLDETSNPRRRTLADDPFLGKLNKMVKNALLFGKPFQQTGTWMISSIRTAPYLAGGDLIKGGNYLRMGFTGDGSALGGMMSELGYPELKGNSLNQFLASRSLALANFINDRAEAHLGTAQQFAATSLGDRFSPKSGYIRMETSKGDVLSFEGVRNGLAHTMLLPETAVTMGTMRSAFFAYIDQHAANDLKQMEADHLSKNGSMEGYDPTIARNQVMDNAVKYAEGILDRAQPRGKAEDTSGIMRNPNSVMSLLSIFKLWDSLVSGKALTYGEAVQKGFINKQQYALHMAADMVLEPMMQTIWRGIYSGDMSNLPAKVLMSSLGTGIAGLGAAPIAGAFGRASTAGNISPDDWTKIPALTPIVDLLKTGEDIKKIIAPPNKDTAAHEEHRWENLWFDGVQTAGMWTGIAPAINLYRDGMKTYQTVAQAVTGTRPEVFGVRTPKEAKSTNEPKYAPYTPTYNPNTPTPHASIGAGMTTP